MKLILDISKSNNANLNIGSLLLKQSLWLTLLVGFIFANFVLNLILMTKTPPLNSLDLWKKDLDNRSNIFLTSSYSYSYNLAITFRLEGTICKSLLKIWDFYFSTIFVPIPFELMIYLNILTCEWIFNEHHMIYSRCCILFACMIETTFLLRVVT